MEMIDDAAVAMRTTDIEKILSEITYSYTYINVFVPIIVLFGWWGFGLIYLFLAGGKSFFHESFQSFSHHTHVVLS